jgi:hypothetical protein
MFAVVCNVDYPTSLAWQSGNPQERIPEWRHRVLDIVYQRFTLVVSIFCRKSQGCGGAAEVYTSMHIC